MIHAGKIQQRLPSNRLSGLDWRGVAEIARLPEEIRGREARVALDSGVKAAGRIVDVLAKSDLQRDGRKTEIWLVDC